MAKAPEANDPGIPQASKPEKRAQQFVDDLAEGDVFARPWNVRGLNP
jgi:hypothetical protein